VNTSILQFKNVSFSYRRDWKPVLHDTTVDFPERQITAILGPNGAGKSTLLLLALSWLKPSGGQILYEGKILSQYSRRQMGQMMSLVPQIEHITFEYSVLEYVLLGRIPYLDSLAQPGAEDFRIAYESLAHIGMAEYAHRSMIQLSGGERQLILIARSLAQQPKLLLMDEPTSHLDLHNKARLVHILRDLERNGVTVLMTTHDPDLASAVASHSLLMNHGRVLYAGPTAEALDQDHLSRLYEFPIQVADVSGRKIVYW
jgi:iron complex transport system ATP-binding protein